ncbi:MAG: hypothetical protein JXK07_00590 [Spirochaetes bacterium]|nr:hypothetical protein [Spirochaetota bacterium]MBN2772184.1 hypothetical protein [Spirochaetota bacterium]
MSIYGWLLSVGLILGGIIGMIDIIARKNAAIAEKIKSFEEYFSYVGVVILGIGIWNAIYIPQYITGIAQYPVYYIAIIVAVISGIVLGLLLGAGIAHHFSAVEDLVKKISEKLVIVKIPFSIAGIIAGLYLVIATLLNLQF